MDFIAAMWPILLISAFAVVAIFIELKYRLPPLPKQGSAVMFEGMWQRSARYEKHICGWKGTAVKYFWRISILAGVGAAFWNFLLTISKAKG
jgi:hypothetical protein